VLRVAAENQFVKSGMPLHTDDEKICRLLLQLLERRLGARSGSSANDAFNPWASRYDLASSWTAAPAAASSFAVRTLMVENVRSAISAANLSARLAE